MNRIDKFWSNKGTHWIKCTLIKIQTIRAGVIDTFDHLDSLTAPGESSIVARDKSSEFGACFLILSC